MHWHGLRIWLQFAYIWLDRNGWDDDVWGTERLALSLKIISICPTGGGQSWRKRKLVYLASLRPVLETAFDLGAGCANREKFHFGDKWGTFVLVPPHMGEDLSPSLSGYLKVTRAQISLLLLYVKGEGNAMFTVSSSWFPGQRTQRLARALQATRAVAESLSDSKPGLCLRNSVCQSSHVLGQSIRFLMERKKQKWRENQASYL